MDITRENQTCLTREKSLSTKCSCSECDSMLCFTKRRFPTCLCSDCKKSKTCIFKAHENNVKATYADQINEAYLGTSKYAKTSEIDPTISTKSGINFELARKRAIEANKPKPKSLEEYLSILLPETTSKVNHKIKPESLAQYIDIIKGNIPSYDKESTLDIYIKKFKEARHEKPFEPVSSHSKERASRPVAQNTTCKGTCKKCRQRKYTQVHNVMLTTPVLNINPRIAKLSSEIMDLPYKGSTSSVSAISKISEFSKDDTQTSKYDFFNYDIFKKIKDVYKACSCKVCECIPTKMLKSEVCNCKPCDCIECTRYINTLHTKRISKPLYHLKCTCSKYKNDNKNSFAPKAKECSCKPCNCAKCQNKEFQKSCNCNPCQCIDCKKIVPLYQVYRGEVHQIPPCQCLPCKCTECLRGYGASSKDAVHEVSTTTSRQSQCQCEICPNDTCKDSLETCKCDNRNIFKKPLERVRHDYDIRTATIKNDIYHHGDDVNKLQEQNTEAIFPVFSQKYQLSNSAKVCTCEECECINYEHQEDAITAIKSSRLFPCESNLSTNGNTRKNCNCKPCECHTNKEGSWPIKKGEVLTPSAHQIKIQKKTKANKLSTIGESKTRLMNKIVCTELNTSRKSVNGQNKLKQGYPKTKSLTSKEDLSITNYNLMQTLSDSNISEFSSSGATSDISFCKKNNEITISKEDHNYWHENNYDLGHNNPSYITRSIVETCFNDVLKSDFNEIKLTDFKVSLKDSNGVSKNNEPEKSVASFTDIQKINNDCHSLMERNTAKISYHDLVPNSIKNYNEYKNTHTSKKVFKAKTNNNYTADRKEDENYPEIRNLNKTHLALRYNCYSCYNLSKIKSDNEDEGFCAEDKYSHCTYFDSIVEDLNIKEDRERVHETLKDAKIFYLHLLQLLETYEKANREFQSISDNLKISHNNLIGEKNENDIKDVETHNLDEHLKEIPTRSPIASNVESQTPNIIYQNINDIRNISQKTPLANLTETITNQDHTIKRLEKQCIKFKSSSILSHPQRATVNQSNEKLSNMDQDSKGLRDEANNELKLKVESRKRSFTKFNSIKNIVFIPKEVCLTRSELNHATTENFKNYSFKNLYHSSENLYSMCVPNFKHSFIEKSGNVNDNFMNNFKKNYEDQKVKFESVRKVSAHSILVKWKPPLDLRNVRGYKMQVDGQAVQKIFSPHNCIAVVTCLQQSDKIELTICTVTYSPTNNCPIATFVYQKPYNKNGFKN